MKKKMKKYVCHEVKQFLKMVIWPNNCHSRRTKLTDIANLLLTVKTSIFLFLVISVITNCNL